VTDGHGSDGLAAVYAARNVAELAEGYARWAEKYEAETAADGYRIPVMCAALVARHVPKGDAPILDAACGTGLAGDCLRALGYPDLVGIDMSEPMLARARGRGIYRDLHRMMLGEPLAFPNATFACVVASGVFTEGHAGPECLDELIRVTRPGGKLVFSMRDETFERRGFRETQAALEAAGRWRLCEATDRFRSFTVAEPDVFGRIYVYQAR
jgi:predicted TPR repeat methyltransferase